MAVERRKGLMGLKLFIRRLQNHLQQSRRVDVFRGFQCEEFEAKETTNIPDDVKEGHFAIIANDEKEKPIRFVVELSVLKHPAFLRLLEMAKEEYGFEQRGALALPCQPEELQRILQDKI